MNYILLKASAFSMPLADESIQCIVTSPPYWALRVYADQDRASQYGLEPTPEAYVSRTIEWLREAKRVLKRDGVCWLNIGDSYFGSLKGAGGSGPSSKKQITNKGSYFDADTLGAITGKQKHPTLKAKDLCLIPERIALAAQEDGWYVRSRVIWHKTNVMPLPVKDRPTNDLEHIWMLTKSPKYYYDWEAVAEPANPKHFGRYKSSFGNKTGIEEALPNGGDHYPRGLRPAYAKRNLRTVWKFSNGQCREAHFATFNQELPRRAILASTRPDDRVLDPFCGSGTTGMVALQLGRSFCGLDLAYHGTAARRLAASLPLPAASNIAGDLP